MTQQPFDRRRFWPADRWPTPNELVEFARVGPTREAEAFFDQLLRHARRGRVCLLRDDDRLVAALARARRAAANARRRAAYWREIARQAS